MSIYEVQHHAFTSTIVEVLHSHFDEDAVDVLVASPILGYLNQKTKSANRGSKARGSFANHYALYVVIEDYINNGYAEDFDHKRYAEYEGARFSDLFQRQRELPFGSKLQNHALNSRLNEEFRKFFPTVNKVPIVRNLDTRRYWIQEDLLLVTIRKRDGEDRTYNIAKAVIDIIDRYVHTKREAFAGFLEACKQIAELDEKGLDSIENFIIQQLSPNVDARIFEIVSYAILKSKYKNETIWIGNSRESVSEEMLLLYKTGRTNANDGGIDFVMKPLGRFFQVTESLDVSKYFLDIDKVHRYPITFVVKSKEDEDSIRNKIQSFATERYKIESVVDTYMDSIEEVINSNDLSKYFVDVVESGQLREVMEEIIRQSEVEFNFSTSDE